METIKIIVVDNHPEVITEIRSLLNTVEEFEIVGVAGEGRESVEMIKDNMPDIILMDLKTPGIDGLKVTQYIRELYPSLKVLAITQYEDQIFIDAFLSPFHFSLLAQTLGVRFIHRFKKN